MYGFNRAALELFASMPQSPVELAEGIDLMRFIERGRVDVLMARVESNVLSVDTPADLDRARAEWRARTLVSNQPPC